ncbi:MAG: ribose-5-phosphate isomerase RpiA [Methanotrichaceae archaeon]|nr:ribose-5-phosphate isomerase RpiA [Methanotrichaceae archaeon]
MRITSENQSEKKAAGESAAASVKDGMIVGLGTGSTVAWTIKMLGRRVVDESLRILGVATSYYAEALAITEGIKLTTLNEHPVLDIAIDGADQVNSELIAIKGGGAAHTREKVVSCSAKKFVVVIDQSKYREKLDHLVPLEVFPFAFKLVESEIKAIGGRPVLRQAKMKYGPVITDNGNFILDVDFGVVENPRILAQKLDRLPGLVEHGIFDNVDELHLGHAKGVEILHKIRYELDYHE